MQIWELIKRNSGVMNSWRGFRDVQDVIIIRLRQLYKHAYVDVRRTVRGASGFGTIPSNTHFRIVEILSFSHSVQGGTEEYLLLSRKGFFSRLEFSAEKLGTSEFPLSVLLSRYHLHYVGPNDLKVLLSAHSKLGVSIMREFRKTMEETVVALSSTLEEQKRKLQEYNAVLMRLSL